VPELTSLDLTTGTAGGTLTVSVTETDFTTTTDPMQFLSSLVRDAPEPATVSVLGAALLMMRGLLGSRRVAATGRHAGLAFSCGRRLGGPRGLPGKVDYTVAMALAGEPTAPGRRNGGAVSRKRERPCARSQSASSDKYQISPR
jgi:hypothetical protein